MDFDDSDAERRFRERCREWLAQNAPQLSTPQGPESESEFVARARAWQARKEAAGYVGISWPTRAGGQGHPPIMQMIFEQEQARYSVALTPLQVSMGMCMPTLWTHGNDEIVRTHVPPAMRGERIWCQLFSEPAAGSDLAGVRTRARRGADGWSISGQKVWTSWAHRSDFGLLLARTDPGVPKHQGLTMFFLDMKSPGVEVRPIRDMTGQRDFNEVFLTEAFVPDSQRIGEVGQGWKIALTTLMHERFAIGRPAGSPGVGALMQLTKGLNLRTDATDAGIARFYLRDAGLEFIRLRLQTALSKGRPPGPESALGKLVMAKTRQDIGAFALSLLESGAIRAATEGPSAAFQRTYLYAPGLRIAGGTEEILRNVIAERVLGLPADVRLDRNVPFSDLAG
jgi:alkylation response protein AidB-like acyl-CoA dehydrogenase